MDQRVKDAVIKHETRRAVRECNHKFSILIMYLGVYSFIWYLSNLVIALIFLTFFVIFVTIFYGIFAGLKMSRSLDKLEVELEIFGDTTMGRLINKELKLIESRLDQDDK